MTTLANIAMVTLPPRHSAAEWIVPVVGAIAGVALLFAFRRAKAIGAKPWLLGSAVLTLCIATWGTMSVMCVHPFARGTELIVDPQGNLHLDVEHPGDRPWEHDHDGDHDRGAHHPGGDHDHDAPNPHN